MIEGSADRPNIRIELEAISNDGNYHDVELLRLWVAYARRHLVHGGPKPPKGLVFVNSIDTLVAIHEILRVAIDQKVFLPIQCMSCYVGSC